MQTIAEFAECPQKFAALSGPTRLRIVQRLLTRGPVNVTELAHELKLPIIKVSHHLRLLREAGIVQSDQRGKFVTYSFKPGVVSRENLMCLDFGCCRLQIARTDCEPGRKS